MGKCLIEFDRDVFYRTHDCSNRKYKVLGLNPEGPLMLITEPGREPYELQCKYKLFPYSCYIVDETDNNFRDLPFCKKQEYHLQNKEIQKYVSSRIDEMEAIIEERKRHMKEIIEKAKINHQTDIDKLIKIIDVGDYSDIDNIETLCCSVFITSQGQVDHSAIRAVKKRSKKVVSVLPGDKDSFGWLTGVLYVDGKQIVVFG